MKILLRNDSDIADYIRYGLPVGDCYIISRTTSFDSDGGIVLSSKPTPFDYRVNKEKKYIQINFEEEERGKELSYTDSEKRILYIRFERSIDKNNSIISDITEDNYDISIEFNGNDEKIFKNVSYIFNLKPNVFGNDENIFDNFLYGERQEIGKETKHYDSGIISAKNININLDFVRQDGELKDADEIDLNDCVLSYNNVIELINDYKLDSNRFCINGCIKTYNC